MQSKTDFQYLLHTFFLVATTLAAPRLGGNERGSKDVCSGERFSINNDVDVVKLPEQECRTIHGDIRIRNIVNPRPIPAYLSIEKIRGSIIIENTNNLLDSINFQNLRIIESKRGPAIQLINNVNLKLALGAHLHTVSVDQSFPTYRILNNSATTKIDENTFNKLYFAAYPKCLFQMDFPLEISQNDSEFYKLLGSVLAFFAFIEAIGIVLTAAFGREPPHED